MPAHQVGDLLVGLHQRNNDTAATPDAAVGWYAWETVLFTAGTAAFVAGETLTQGAVTATIVRVDRTSGTWGSDAAGFLTIRSRAGGNFAAGAATSASGAATLSAAQVGRFFGAGASSIFAWKIAATTSEVWGDWVQGGRRQVWVFRNAAIGVRNGSSVASGTSVAWPELQNIQGPALVGGGLFCNTAQVAMTGKGPTGWTERAANAGGGNFAADTNVTYLNSFAGEGGKTIDTASIHTVGVFSVRAAA
ncbi:MAG: hypothetical protein BWX64_01442 [Acidobacteria bacterium ADurb.Bin051]|nr:MAG: hypothetical protein BWX64_01442 [Acidobacteria bacterium ADurb.Bin051]